MHREQEDKKTTMPYSEVCRDLSEPLEKKVMCGEVIKESEICELWSDSSNDCAWLLNYMLSMGYTFYPVSKEYRPLWKKSKP